MLARDSHQGDEVTLRIEPHEERILVWLRPVDAQGSDEGDSEGIGLDRVLATLVDSAELVSLAGERWLCLEQRIPTRSDA